MAGGAAGAQGGGVPGSPAGKVFQDRLDAFLKDAKTSHDVGIPTKAEFRKAEDAQKWHVAHMIVFNSFASQKPAAHQLRNGHNVIKWDHLQEPKNWQHVRWEDFLRTKTGQLPVRQGNGWAPGKGPDEEATRKRALEILAAAGVAKAKNRSEAHSAMVAPGYDGCAPPCKCGGHRSNHISGQASDLGQAELAKLGEKLKKKGTTLDAYLKSFGLHRPMASEPWHVEASNDKSTPLL